MTYQTHEALRRCRCSAERRGNVETALAADAAMRKVREEERTGAYSLPLPELREAAATYVWAARTETPQALLPFTPARIEDTHVASAARGLFSTWPGGNAVATLIKSPWALIGAQRAFTLDEWRSLVQRSRQIERLQARLLAVRGYAVPAPLIDRATGLTDIFSEDELRWMWELATDIIHGRYAGAVRAHEDAASLDAAIIIQRLTANEIGSRPWMGVD